MINEDYTEWVDKHLDSFAASSPVTEKDETGSVQLDSPFYLHFSDPADFKGAMTAAVQFCLFNTGCLSKSEVWDILKDCLMPEVLNGVIQVQMI